MVDLPKNVGGEVLYDGLEENIVSNRQDWSRYDRVSQGRVARVDVGG